MKTLYFSGLALSAFLLVVGVAGAKETPPNVVLIFIDDMGYADIGPFGNTQLRTPNLDQMAKDGRKFTSFYATPVCSMSRASLMTGCYNRRVSVPGVFQPTSDSGLHPDEVTLADLAKQNGYATACFGKWHLGDRAEFLPLKQGFDEFFGIPYSNNMITGYRKNTTPPLPLYQGETVLETEPDQSQFTRRFTEAAVNFIKAKKDQPFFVYLPHPMVHVPLFASENFRGKSKQGPIGDAIEEIDWSVGQILATLKELNLDEQTLVIFTSDNGPDKRPAPPFRGAKSTCLEGGVREPCIMRWPGKIPAGSTTDHIAGNIDVLPTMAKLIGGSLDAKRTLDGRDISTLLFESAPAAVRDTQLYYGTTGQLVAIRHGDWKLFFDAENAAGGKNGKRPKAEISEKVPVLYDLKNDLGEANDMASQHAEIVTRLTEKAKAMNAEIIQNARPIGKISN